jgi:hypothetical protein
MWGLQSTHEIERDPRIFFLQHQQGKMEVNKSLSHLGFSKDIHCFSLLSTHTTGASAGIQGSGMGREVMNTLDINLRE